jgi:hypothetical protein
VIERLSYTNQLRHHYESHFGMAGKHRNLELGPVEKLHPDFFVFEIPPNHRHKCWVYCSVGMALDQDDDGRIELFVLSPRQDAVLVELITICASFHRNEHPLDLHHTVNIGKPWLNQSACDHAFVSLPYLDGEALELFQFEDKTVHCYWLIPITKQEREYKIEQDCEALEQLFEDKGVDYLNPQRKSLV